MPLYHTGVACIRMKVPLIIAYLLVSLELSGRRSDETSFLEDFTLPYVPLYHLSRICMVGIRTRLYGIDVEVY